MSRRPSTTRQPRTPRALVALLALLALIAAACGGAGDDDAAEADPTAADGADPGGSEPAGDLASLIADAEDEGEVVLYAGGHTRPGLDALKASFEEAYDITVTFVREDSGGVAQSVEAELAAGNLSTDVVSLTDAPTMLRWAEEGIITDAPIPDDVEIIEGLDDPATPQVPYSLVPLGIMYNSATFDESEVPATWEAFAEEEAVIAMADPNASGTALQWVAMMTDLVGDEFFSTLAEQDPIVVDSSLALAQLVITGEADFAVPAIESAVIDAAAGGEPIAVAFPEEGVPSFASELAALSDAPHPAAAQLLVHHHLTADFQAELAELGARSVLVDGPTPTGGADLSDANVVSPDHASLESNAEDLRSRFDELFKS